MENASPNKALWGGRFEAQPTEFLQRYGASLPFDKRMWAEDIQGSKAHAKMLAHVGVISQEDADAIRVGLDEVGADIAAGNFDFDINDEDIHMSVEKSLTQRIGAAGRGHAVDPCRKGAVPAKLREPLPDAQHRLLRHVLPVMGIAHHAQAQGIDPLFIRAHQRFKRGRVAALCRGDQAAFHALPPLCLTYRRMEREKGSRENRKSKEKN